MLMGEFVRGEREGEVRTSERGVARHEEVAARRRDEGCNQAHQVIIHVPCDSEMTVGTPTTLRVQLLSMALKADHPW